jgi:hypothetical protein
VGVIGDDSYADWCGKKNSIRNTTLIDVTGIREAISSDFHLEGVFGDHPPISPTSGWVDPLPPETEFIDYAFDLLYYPSFIQSRYDSFLQNQQTSI